MAAHQRLRRRGDGPLDHFDLKFSKHREIFMRPRSGLDIKSPDFRGSGRSGKDADAEFSFLSFFLNNREGDGVPVLLRATAWGKPRTAHNSGRKSPRKF